MCFGGGGKSAKRIAEAQRSDEIARQNRIRAGMADIARAFGGFNDEFYAKRAQDYTDYAMPDVERQAERQRKNLIYALSRTGNLDSSAAADRSAELTEEENAARITVANNAQNEANNLRNQVENTRSGVVAELNATGDSQAASNAALRQVQSLNQPVGFSPLGNLFASFAQTVGQIGSNAGNNYSGFAGQGRGLFTPSSRGSQRVVGG